jgi:hypothetical protein
MIDKEERPLVDFISFHIPIQVVGCRYAWSNERNIPTMEKLNKWLCSIEWEEMHLDATLVACSFLPL